MNTEFNIFFTINNQYAKYLAVTIVSILYNLKKDCNINFFVLDGGITDENKRKINELKKIKNFYIEYIKINPNRFYNIKQSSESHISNETNYRFLISYLKKDLNKCLFLDADLIIDKDISELYNTNIDDYYIAAVPDQLPLNEDYLKRNPNWLSSFNLPKNYRYVNTGVILVNLKKWREDNIENELFNNVMKYSDTLMFPDQDTLNITLCNKVKKLNHKYNAMPVQHYIIENEKLEAFDNPTIIHWAGRRKPWIYIDAPYSDYFWKYARMTFFYEDIIYSNIAASINNKLNNINNKINNKFNNLNKRLDLLINNIAW